MNKTKKLIFLRHFKPNIDKNKPVAEWDLNEEGKQAMNDLIKRDVFKNVDKIFTSPESKAKITAEKVSEKYNLQIIECEEASEVDRSKSGFLEGDYTEFVKSYLTESNGHDLKWEDINSVKKRSKLFVERIGKENEGTFLVISHGMWISLLLANYFNKNVVDFWKSLEFGHILEVDYEKLRDIMENG